MANITRIKASDTRKRHDLDDAAEAEVVTTVKATPKSKTEAETAAKSKKQAEKESAPQEATEQTSQRASVAKNNGKNASNTKKAGNSKKANDGEKASKKVNSSEKAGKKAGKKHKTPKFIRVITKPFRAFGRYLRDSWGELRQVRWPSRKATWKLTLAVIVYCGILIAIIMGLDLVFTELFGWILG